MIENNKLEHFEKILNFKFKNKQNLINSLLHPSYVKEKSLKDEIVYNIFERLEFLGDRVLGLIISNLIYNKFKDSNEGDLTKKLSYLVKKDFLFKIALEINIDKFLKYSFKKNNPRMNKSILADSVESLIGSIFIDSGYNKTLKFIESIWGKYLNLEASNKQDPKTHLQELLQQKSHALPQYLLLKKEGPPHSPIFTVTLEVLNLKIINGKGKSKREAEKNAAQKALNLIYEK